MELKQLKDLVIRLLKNNEVLRGSDDLLYLRVLEEYRVDVEKMTVRDFFNYRKNWHLPNFESVSRCRRKAQEEHKELRPSEAIQLARLSEEEKFYNFATKQGELF